MCASPKTGTDAQAVPVNDQKNARAVLTVVTAFCISAEVCWWLSLLWWGVARYLRIRLGKLLGKSYLLGLIYYSLSVTHTNSLIKPRLRLWKYELKSCYAFIELFSLPTLKQMRPRHSFWMWGSQWYLSAVFVCQGKTIPVIKKNYVLKVWHPYKNKI